jgi:hypothetical protein
MPGTRLVKCYLPRLLVFTLRCLFRRDLGAELRGLGNERGQPGPLLLKLKSLGVRIELN